MHSVRESLSLKSLSRTSPLLAYDFGAGAGAGGEVPGDGFDGLAIGFMGFPPLAGEFFFAGGFAGFIGLGG